MNHWLIKYRLLILLLFTGITLLSLLFIPRLEVNPDLDKYIPDNINMVGSEMRMTNITAQDTDELSFRLLGREEVGGKSCHHIEVKAIDAQDQARGELLIEEDSYHIVQINVFDKGGKLTSSVKLSDFQPVDGAARKVQPMQILTEDIEKQRLTEIRILKIASRTDLKEEDFQLPAEKDL